VLVLHRPELSAGILGRLPVEIRVFCFQRASAARSLPKRPGGQLRCVMRVGLLESRRG
jgi:hypothetical protein